MAFRAVGAPSERVPPTLTSERLSVLEATAQHHARRVANRFTGAHSDIPDIRQSLLLAALPRIGRFDSKRAGWSTFINLVVQHAAGDYARRCLQRKPLEAGSLDDPSLSQAIARSAVAHGRTGYAQAEQSLDVQRAIETLPEHLRRLCRLLEQEPPSVAQRQSGLSQAEFYRQINEIRMRFRALGLYQTGTC